MVYLFILESIGTAELLMIGLVALIIFGPRKLPELARMLGKAMNEFRRTTDDFKETWAREVDFEKDEKQLQPEISALAAPENSIQKNETAMKNEIVTPEIREISQADFENKIPEQNAKVSSSVSNSLSEKRDWL